jgi:uncharacterized membrane protein
MTRFIIWFVALDWIVFGTMHFTGHEQAVKQMPAFFPAAWASPLVYLSGALETAAGLLILAPSVQLRRIGAMLSLAVLAGISPAIVYITVTDTAFLANEAVNAVFRYVVLPHALLIAWLSVVVWRSATPPPHARPA